jgi:hypothetical protein
MIIRFPFYGTHWIVFGINMFNMITCKYKNYYFFKKKKKSKSKKIIFYSNLNLFYFLK